MTMPRYLRHIGNETYYDKFHWTNMYSLILIYIHIYPRGILTLGSGNTGYPLATDSANLIIGHLINELCDLC
jgi:hypothetical protein